jgi:hypothetical protein
MSSSNLVSVKYVPEVTYDTVPANSPDWKYTRFTGESLSATADTTTSSEIRRDRSISDMPLVSITTGGFLDIEFSADTFDDFIEAALASTWQAATPAIGSQQLKLGTAESSFSVEKHFEDINKFVLYSGMRVGTFNLSMAYGSILTGSIGFAGASASTPATSAVGTGSVASATTTEVLNSTSDFGTIEIGGVATTICLSSMDISIDNSLRAIGCIGSATAKDQKLGTANITGTIEIYLDASSFAYYEAALNNTSTSLKYTVTDGINTYEFFLPKIKLSSDSPQASSLDTDTMVSLSYTALYDPTEQSSIVITKTTV